MKHAGIYAALRGKADVYYDEHRAEIEGEWNAERRDTILRVMPGLLADVTVWCRNGEFCRYATPCDEVDCAYKKGKDDVVVGCAACQRFQVTAFSNNWRTAAHLFPPGRVEGGAGDCPSPEPAPAEPLSPNPPDPKPNPSILVPLTEGEKPKPRPVERQTRTWNEKVSVKKSELDVFKRRLVRKMKERISDAGVGHVDYATQIFCEILEELGMDGESDELYAFYEKAGRM